MSKPKKPDKQPDDAKQSARFIETAKELEADKNEAAFEAAFRVIAVPKSGENKTAKKPPKG